MAIFPQAVEIFKSYKIDFCCGGTRPLSEVVAEKGINGGEVLLPHHPGTVSMAGFAANLIPVTLGNIVGGAVILAGAYNYVSQPSSPGVGGRARLGQ